MNKLPRSRTADIVVQSLGNEVLIYDLKSHLAYNLNETSSVVYLACDGETSFDELRSKSNFTDYLIFLALEGLNKENLLESDSYRSPFAGLSRREVIKKVGLAAMITLPVITKLIAPTAATAASRTTCVAPNQKVTLPRQSTQASCALLSADDSVATCCSKDYLSSTYSRSTGACSYTCR